MKIMFDTWKMTKLLAFACKHALLGLDSFFPPV